MGHFFNKLGMRPKRRKANLVYKSGLFFVITCGLALFSLYSGQQERRPVSSGRRMSGLGLDGDGEPPAVDGGIEEPYPDGTCNTFLESQYRGLAMFLLFWGVFYMFWGLAIVCDDYFVTSLEDISKELELSEDVAGATFMAAGSSAPELFTSLMGVFAVESDVGIGTIVGSAVFNLCCIIGGTAMFVPGTLALDWKPLTRDSLFYGLSITAMIIVIEDQHVNLVEAVALVASYFVYVFVMYKNQGLMEFLDRLAGGPPEIDEQEPNEDDEQESESPLGKAMSRPLQFIFQMTIPDCSQPGNEDRYLWTFFASIMWIGVLSYYMVLWATKIGCLLDIHPAIMGVTALAAGTSVPDAIGSLLVAAEGQGNMAVSNAIGSNVFDILLGLGLPWLLSNGLLSKQVHVHAENMVPMTMILFGTLMVIYATIALMKFTLNKLVGAIFFSMYFLFVGYTLAHEFPDYFGI